MRFANRVHYGWIVVGAAMLGLLTSAGVRAVFGVLIPPGMHLFAILFGLNYISTVPPTSSLTACIFGRRSAGELFGWIFVSHQIGAALGSWGGGYLYDVTRSYTSAFLSAAVLAFLASAMVLAIRETPYARPAMRQAVET